MLSTETLSRARCRNPTAVLDHSLRRQALRGVRSHRLVIEPSRCRCRSPRPRRIGDETSPLRVTFRGACYLIHTVPMLIGFGTVVDEPFRRRRQMPAGNLFSTPNIYQPLVPRSGPPILSSVDRTTLIRINRLVCSTNTSRCVVSSSSHARARLPPRPAVRIFAIL